MKVLVIHPDAAFYQHLQPLLSRYTSQAKHVTNVADATYQTVGLQPDLVIVASSILTDATGAMFERMAAQPTPPLVVITNSQSLADYAPHEQRRLESALMAVQNMMPRSHASIVKVGELRIDPLRKRVALRGYSATLPPLQFRLLSHLAEHAGEVVEYDDLIQAAWECAPQEIEARDLLKFHIRQIRRKLGIKADNSDYLKAVRGFGYLLEDPNLREQD